MLLKAERLKAERFRATLTAIVALALSLALAACGGGSTDDAAVVAPEDPAAVTATVTQVPTTPAPVASSVVATTAAPATTVTAEPTVEEIEAEIIAAYIQGWDDYYAVLEDTSLDPEFARETHTDEAFQVLLDFQRSSKEEGVLVRWPENTQRMHSPQVLVHDKASATLTDCFVNDAFGLKADGSVINDELATSNWAIEMRLEDGTWKTAFTSILRRELGIWDCS